MGIEFMLAPEDVKLLFDEFELDKEYFFRVYNWTDARTVASNGNKEAFIVIEASSSEEYQELRIRKGTHVQLYFSCGAFKREWSRHRLYLDLNKKYYGDFKFKIQACGKEKKARKMIFTLIEVKEI